MTTIYERAMTHITRSFTDMNDFQAGYMIGAEEQMSIDNLKARKAFCYATCGDNCPLKTNDIEDSGVFNIKCDKFEAFYNEIIK